MVESFLRVNEPTVSETNRVVDMAVFGHLVTTPAMHRIGVQRFGVAGLRLKMLTIRTMFRDFFFNLRFVTYLLVYLEEERPDLVPSI